MTCPTSPAWSTPQAVDCLQADVTRCGGFTEWQRAAAVAAARGLQVSGHCAPNLHAHVAAAVPNLRHLEYFHDHARIESMLFDGALDPSGGSLRPDPPARPRPDAQGVRRRPVPRGLNVTGRLHHGQRGGGKPVCQLGTAQWLTGGGKREH